MSVPADVGGALGAWHWLDDPSISFCTGGGLKVFHLFSPLHSFSTDLLPGTIHLKHSHVSTHLMFKTVPRGGIIIGPSFQVREGGTRSISDLRRTQCLQESRLHTGWSTSSPKPLTPRSGLSRALLRGTDELEGEGVSGKTPSARGEWGKARAPKRIQMAVPALPVVSELCLKKLTALSLNFLNCNTNIIEPTRYYED